MAGEAPLWDFPDGTLAGREVGAYLVSAALGWNVVPLHRHSRRTCRAAGWCSGGSTSPATRSPTNRDDESTTTQTSSTDTGPDLVDLLPAGHVPPGFLPILQAYDYAGDEVTLVHADDARLRRMAVFDVLINNADRKGGHILAGVDGGVYGVDHGVSLHTEDKLRTVLWGWAGKPVDDDTLRDVAALRDALLGDFDEVLRPHITNREIDALYARTVGLLENPVMPRPDRRRPIPWPAF